MALETGTYISDLVATNPTGSDPLAFADDHLRLLKSTIKATFPNISGAVTKTHTEINTAVDQAAAALPRAGGTMTGALVLAGAPTADLQASTKKYVDDREAAITAASATSYPTKTGTGASGTWGINITGNAATASNGGVTSVNGQTGAVTVQSFGVGQSWQSPTRALGTSYTNSTGKPIAVSVMINLANGATSTLTVGSVTVARAVGRNGAYIQDTSSGETLYAIIPDGASYSVSGGSLVAWAELR